jgi:outer membrane protein OmpA-like peptidoglycan-associated protein
LKLQHTRTKAIKFFLVLSSLFLPAIPPGFANTVGPEAQNFNPTTSGIDFVTVQSADVLEPGVLNLGLFFNQAINTLPYFEDQGDQNRTRINDQLIMGDFNVGFGVLPNFEIGFSYPRIMYQKVTTGADRGQFGNLGNTEWRFMGKYKLFGDAESGGALVLSANVNRTENNPYAGQDPGPTYNLEYAHTLDVWGLKLGGNIGYRMKQPGDPIPDSPIEPTDDQLIASVASSYFLESLNSKLIVEVFGARPAKKSESSVADRQKSSLEGLGGIKHFITDNLALHAGGGTELIHGAFSPDWRIYAGINWTLSSEVKAQEEEQHIQIIERKENSLVVQDRFESKDVSKVPIEKGEITVNFGKIYFEVNSATNLLPGAEKTLQLLVDYVKKPPPVTKIVVEGHTDSMGSDVYNLDLSVRRAQTIRNILISHYGLDPHTVDAIGYGETRPIADNGNFQGRQDNRRVDFRIVR